MLGYKSKFTLQIDLAQVQKDNNLDFQDLEDRKGKLRGITSFRSTSQQKHLNSSLESIFMSSCKQAGCPWASRQILSAHPAANSNHSSLIQATDTVALLSLWEGHIRTLQCSDSWSADPMVATKVRRNRRRGDRIVSPSHRASTVNLSNLIDSRIVTLPATSYIILKL